MNNIKKGEKMVSKLSIENTPNEVLKKLVEVHGIDIVKDFIKDHNKQSRKKSIHVNNYDKIACEVYSLVFNETYSKTRAMDKVAEDNDLSPHTVRNHCSKFDKEANQFDYFSFGALIDEAWAFLPHHNDRETIGYIAQLNNVKIEIAKIYYAKYKHSSHTYTKETATTNIDKFSKPFEMTNHNPF